MDVFVGTDKIGKEWLWFIMRRRRVEMFRKKQVRQAENDKDNWKPVLKCSICNGEQVAGFKNIHTGEFKEECLIRSLKELEAFRQKYGIEEIAKEY